MGSICPHLGIKGEKLTFSIVFTPNKMVFFGKFANLKIFKMAAIINIGHNFNFYGSNIIFPLKMEFLTQIIAIYSCPTNLLP